MKNDVWRAPRSNDARDILKSQEISACRKRKEKNLDEHRQMEKDTGRLSGDTLSSMHPGCKRAVLRERDRQ